MQNGTAKRSEGLGTDSIVGGEMSLAIGVMGHSVESKEEPDNYWMGLDQRGSKRRTETEAPHDSGSSAIGWRRACGG